MKKLALLFVVLIVLVSPVILSAADKKVQIKTVIGYVLNIGPGNRGQDIYSVGADATGTMELDASKLPDNINQCLSEALSERYKVRVSAKVDNKGEINYKTLKCEHINPR